MSLLSNIQIPTDATWRNIGLNPNSIPWLVTISNLVEAVLKKQNGELTSEQIQSLEEWLVAKWYISQDDINMPIADIKNQQKKMP